jgi:hypothetical protein
MKRSSNALRCAAAAVFSGVIVTCPSPATAKPLGSEAQRLIDALLAPPTIKAEPGFKARLLTPPGELYDPLFMIQHGNAVWMNDDGKATDGHGSRILAVAPNGSVSVLFDADKILPVVGFGLAPPGFGVFTGQIFTLAQPTTGMKGGLANHVIQRIDPATHKASVFCTLPQSGRSGNGVAGFGAAAAFGPTGSGFANRFFSITVLNKTIYQTTADGACKPFADLSATGATALAFTADGSAMLVSGTPADPMAPGEKPQGTIMRVAPDGKLDPKPVASGLETPMGIAVAPSGFGAYGGEIFVADAGKFEMPVPQSQAPAHDGKIYRVTSSGALKLVASGFVNPSGLAFVDGHLWVTDVNGDFIGGGRELPDGFLVQIDAP